MCRSSGMHHESAGREVQAAGSSGGSHAEGAEVSPTTEGRRKPTAPTISQRMDEERSLNTLQRFGLYSQAVFIKT